MTITFLPSALAFSKKVVQWMEDFYGGQIPMTSGKKSENDTLLKILLGLCYFVIGNYKKVLIGFSIIIVGTVIGISNLKYETNFINYLPDSNSIKQDIKSLQNKFGGSVPFVAVAKAKSSEYDFTHPDSLKLLEKIQGDLIREVDKFETSFSIMDYMKEVHRAFNENKVEFYKIPDDNMVILDYYLLSDRRIMGRLVSPDKMEATITFQAKWGSNEEAKSEAIHISEYLEKNLGENHTINFTGLTTLYVKMEHRLKQSLIRSFSVAFVIILFMMLFVCRSFSLTLLCMIPNLLPILVTIGIMGWLKLPLDVSTIMIASITLGIAVDDTIHFVVGLRRYFVSHDKINASLLHVFREVGKPVTVTSIVLFSGFIILLFGSILPTKTFGALSSFAIIFALICDLLLLPALIIIFKPKIIPIDDAQKSEVSYKRPSGKRFGLKAMQMKK
ncbi:MAG: MMPL family transporter [Spirochaetota bacterium]|nr:MMPL family transporter [Spirochaetota bacterium]